MEKQRKNINKFWLKESDLFRAMKLIRAVSVGKLSFITTQVIIPGCIAPLQHIFRQVIIVNWTVLILFSFLNLCCGYSLEASHQVTSNTCPHFHKKKLEKILCGYALLLGAIFQGQATVSRSREKWLTICKQWGHWSAVAFWGIWSGSALFTKLPLRGLQTTMS